MPKPGYTHKQKSEGAYPPPQQNKNQIGCSATAHIDVKNVRPSFKL